MKSKKYYIPRRELMSNEQIEHPQVQRFYNKWGYDYISKEIKVTSYRTPMNPLENLVKHNIHRLRPNFEIGSLVGRNSK